MKWGELPHVYLEHSNVTGKLNSTNLLLHTLLDKDPIKRASVLAQSISPNVDFDDYAYLTQGTSTYILLGRAHRDNETHVSVIRLSAHLQTSRGKMFRNDTIRSHFPGLIQPTQETLNIGDKMQAEIMPFYDVRTLATDEKAKYQPLFKHLTEGTCFKLGLEEVVELPDTGILMAIDPGEATYQDAFWDLPPAKQQAWEEQSIGLILERLQDPTIPPELRWDTLPTHQPMPHPSYIAHQTCIPANRSLTPSR